MFIADKGDREPMNTARTQIKEPSVEGRMKCGIGIQGEPKLNSSINLYVRHLGSCTSTKKEDKKCGCPIWVYDPSRQRNRQRFSSGTNDWTKAYAKVAEIESQSPTEAKTKDLTVADAINLYLVKRSKKEKHAEKAPYRDKYILRDGSDRQESLLTWAIRMRFSKLKQITFTALDEWRDGWVMRENSHSLKLNSHRAKAFFTWAVLHDYLTKSPFDKLESIKVVEIPTLALSQEQFQRLLANTDAVKPIWQSTVMALILLMRWSGLAIRDASCLRRDALDANNRLRTYRQTTGEFVYVKLRSDVADILRAEKCGHPDFFFWNKGAGRTAWSQANRTATLIREVFGKTGITPLGTHRLRDTFAVEFLNGGGADAGLVQAAGGNP
jgi:integrase/recombinase XerD